MNLIRAVLLLALATLLSACQPKPPPAPRNLVVICMDTVRYDSFMRAGIDDELTPWLSSAQQFTNAMSAAPWTIPSVSSLLTGLYPIEHGAGAFEPEVADLDTQVPSALDTSVTTLAEILAGKYFRTGAFVSHPFFTSKLGLEQGFQVLHSRRGWFRDLSRMWKWADQIKPPDRFFGYLHFMEAHHRHTGTDEELEGYLAQLDPPELATLRGLHPDICAEPDSHRCKQAVVYEAAVLELRKAVATVLAQLKQRGLLDQTLVLLYSDHGEEFWDHEAEEREYRHDSDNHVGYGHGQSMYQELLHVPLLIWHPGMPGAVWEQSVSLVDVLPSLLAWMGIDTDQMGLRFSGELLPPLQRRRWFTSPPERTLYASGIAYGPQQVAIRRGNLKSIFHLQDDHFEFYDLAADPLEHEPLSDSGLVLEFDTLTGDYLERTPVARTVGKKLDEEQIKKLKAIGYLQGVNEPQTQGEQPPPPSANEDDHDGGKQP